MSRFPETAARWWLSEGHQERTMATQTITSDNIDATIQNNETVILDFWAEWCGPCKRFGPVFEAASEKYPDVVFGKIDTEAQQELAGAFGIQSIPTLMIFRQKILLFSQPGALPAAAVDELLGKVAALDMEEIHRKIAEQAAAGEPES
jgi:thioredoxin 1